MLCAKVGFPFSILVKEVWPEHFISRYFGIDSRCMGLGTIKKAFGICEFYKSVKDNYLHFLYDGYIVLTWINFQMSFEWSFGIQ